MRSRVLAFLAIAMVLLLGGATVTDARGGWHPKRFPSTQVVHYKNFRTTTTRKPTTTTAKPTTTTVRTTTTVPPTTTTAGSQWRAEYSEDFNTDAPEGQFLKTYGNFDAYPYDWHDTSGYGTYQPNILSVAGGNLIIGLRTQNGEHLVAAPEPKVNNGSTNQLYGRYEIKFKADQIAGYKTAWLLWPQSNQWNDGEIDFPEGDLDGGINAFNHYAGNPTNQDGFGTGADFSAWHDAVTEWTPGKVTFILDGKVIGTSTSHVMAKPAHWVIQTETAIGQGPPPDSSAGQVLIDYVKAWSYTG